MRRTSVLLWSAGLVLLGVVIGAALDGALLSSMRRTWVSRDRERERQASCVARALTMEQSSRVTIPEGLWGTVCLWEGDFMPGPPHAPPRGRTVPASRTIYIHHLTHASQLVPPGPERMFYSAVRTPIVDSTRSDGRGFFQLQLRPGRYSLIVREGSRYYASRTDGHGNVFPVMVDSGRVNYVRVDLMYGVM